MYTKFGQKILSEKAFSELGSIGTPPLTTNGSVQYLDHLSVNCETSYMASYKVDVGYKSSYCNTNLVQFSILILQKKGEELMGMQKRVNDAKMI